MSTTLTFDVTLFREQFPKYADPLDYPDATLQMYWDLATCFVSDLNCGALKDSCRQYALNLLVAHYAYINTITNAPGDGQPQIETASTVGRVSVTLQPPPSRDLWDWWLNLSPYGQQLHALLLSYAVGGIIVGGSLEATDFLASAYGSYGNSGWLSR